MSRIISFAWTSPALQANAKTVTRREWDPDYARQFKAGDLVQAWDKSPRVRGAKKIATIRLTAAPTYERDADAPDSDYEAEGFPWLADNQHLLPASVRKQARVTLSREYFDAWRRAGGSSWVVRFDLVELATELGITGIERDAQGVPVALNIGRRLV